MKHFAVGTTVLCMFLLSACTQPFMSTPTERPMKSPDVVEGEYPMNEDGGAVSKGEKDMSGDHAVGRSFTYRAYTPEDFENVAGPKVLYFHANWCPTCVALERTYLEKAEEIEGGQVTIFKASYDEDTALRQEYGVTVQHTSIGFDAEGNEVARDIGMTRVEQVNAFLQQL